MRGFGKRERGLAVQGPGFPFFLVAGGDVGPGGVRGPGQEVALCETGHGGGSVEICDPGKSGLLAGGLRQPGGGGVGRRTALRGEPGQGAGGLAIRDRESGGEFAGGVRWNDRGRFG